MSGHMSAGDKQAFHVTLCLTTSADGKNNIPAYVIHSSSSKEPDPEKIIVDLAKFNAFLVSDEEVAKGIDGTVTRSGSMLKGKFIVFIFLLITTSRNSTKLKIIILNTKLTPSFFPPLILINIIKLIFDKATFPRWCYHFVRHLPEKYGKGKLPVVLFLDGHASREVATALQYLEENNVFGCIIPSHSSIFAQVNDVYVNKHFKKCFGKCVARNKVLANISAHTTFV